MQHDTHESLEELACFKNSVLFFPPNPEAIIFLSQLPFFIGEKDLCVCFSMIFKDLFLLSFAGWWKVFWFWIRGACCIFKWLGALAESIFS